MQRTSARRQWKAFVLPLLAAVGCGGNSRVDLPTAPLPPTTTTACGVERWSVKTLSDSDATRVDPLSVTATTIPALNALASRCTDLPDRRAFAEEFRVYEVIGVVQLIRNEDDRDVHIALADPADAAKTIVVEVIDPGCATSSPFLTTLSSARTQYQNLGSLAGKTVRVRGVGFYDFAHGQAGRSQSCIELHPVLGISPR